MANKAAPLDTARPSLSRAIEQRARLLESYLGSAHVACGVARDLAAFKRLSIQQNTFKIMDAQQPAPKKLKLIGGRKPAAAPVVKLRGAAAAERAEADVRASVDARRRERASSTRVEGSQRLRAARRGIAVRARAIRRATRQVLAYLRRFQRPNSAAQLWENTNKIVSKKEVQAALDRLSADGRAKRKEYGKTVLYGRRRGSPSQTARCSTRVEERPYADVET